MAKFIINTGGKVGPGQEIEDERLIRQYLLDELSEEGQAKVQDRLLCDREFFDRLVVEENELMDDYLRGALTRQREEKFESYFLASPERRQKLRFAKALKKRISEEALSKPRIEGSLRRKHLFGLKGFSLPSFAAGAVAALIFVVGAWVAIENARLRRQIDNARAAQAEWLERAQQSERRLSDEKQRNRELTQEIERERSHSLELEREAGRLKQAREAGRAGISGGFVSLALMPGLSREGDQSNQLANQLEIPQGTSRVRLELYPEKVGHKNYRAELRTREGRPIWSGNGLKLRKTISGDQVVVYLPAAILTKGDYVLMLRGVEGAEIQERAGTYYFRIVKE
ncbi:MAG TPA: hypothetical protein VHR27_16940 [Blastocatellia bacterium]|jgi:hypothetical protein|nr:hypothetical protein [Blastocatellia bacterium]